MSGTTCFAYHLHLLLQLHVGVLVSFGHRVQIIDGQPVRNDGIRCSPGFPQDFHFT